MNPIDNNSSASLSSASFTSSSSDSSPMKTAPSRHRHQSSQGGHHAVKRARTDTVLANAMTTLSISKKREAERAEENSSEERNVKREMAENRLPSFSPSQDANQRSELVRLVQAIAPNEERRQAILNHAYTALDRGEPFAQVVGTIFTGALLAMFFSLVRS